MSPRPVRVTSPDPYAGPRTDCANRGSRGDDTHWWKAYARHGCIDGAPQPQDDAPGGHDTALPPQRCPA